MGYSAVSLFSGCGGFCEGARLAGFDVEAAVENDPFATQTYQANFPDIPLFDDDVHSFLNPKSETWLDRKHEFQVATTEPIDLVFGGPPCQGFSQIGTRNSEDPRNSMYKQFARVATELKPRVVLLENVPNMLLLNKGVFAKRILKAFADAGYGRMSYRVLSATDFGVPQLRRRVFFLGIRDDCDELDMTPGEILDSVVDAETRAQTTVWQAIGDLPESVTEPHETLPYPATKRRNSILTEMRIDREGEFYTAKEKLTGADGKLLHNHHTKEIQERRLSLIRQLEAGKKADSLPKDVWDGLRPEKWRRLDPDQPSHTILAHMHRDLSEWVHPTFDRWITVREAARLQAFHDGFVFHSSEWQMLKQIGNAVPPLLARVPAVAARQVLEALDAVETEENSPHESELDFDRELIAA